MLVGVGHQLDRDHIQHREAVPADRVQLLLQPLLDHRGQRVAIGGLGVGPGGRAQLLLGPLHRGRIGALGDGPQPPIDHGGDPAGVFHHDLKRLFFGQIVELGQHIPGVAVKERGLMVGVLEAVARLQHRPVDRVLRVFEVHVPGGDHRLVQRLAELQHRFVELLDLLDRVDQTLPQHILVVAQRLDL